MDRSPEPGQGGFAVKTRQGRTASATGGTRPGVPGETRTPGIQVLHLSPGPPGSTWERKPNVEAAGANARGQYGPTWDSDRPEFES